MFYQIEGSEQRSVELFPISQMRRLRHRDDQYLAQGHTGISDRAQI